MNYYDARQIKTGSNAGKWHYTCMNDRVVWPIGYCESCDGHETKKEAYQCYYKYILDHMRISEPKTKEWPKDKCASKECNSEATRTITMDNGWDVYHLCEEHANRETVEKELFTDIGWSCSS